MQGAFWCGYMFGLVCRGFVCALHYAIGMAGLGCGWVPDCELCATTMGLCFAWGAVGTEHCAKGLRFACCAGCSCPSVFALVNGLQVYIGLHLSGRSAPILWLGERL